MWYTNIYMRHNTLSFGNWIRSRCNTQTIKRRLHQVIGAIYTQMLMPSKLCRKDKINGLTCGIQTLCQNNPVIWER